MSMRGLAALGVAGLFGLGCAGLAEQAEEAVSGGGAAGEAQGGCLDRPNREYGPDNFSEPQVFVKRGDVAADFELRDLDGKAYRLSELLKSKPVLLVGANYTCPVYQRMRGKIDRLQEVAGDSVTVVLVYGPEAHPRSEPSPYSGDLWAMPDKFSDFNEARTYDERVQHARRLKGSDRVLTLVETLDNPVWCTYGTAPNPGYLIRQDGTFEAVHDWFDPPTMVESVKALIGRRPKGRR